MARRAVNLKASMAVPCGCKSKQFVRIDRLTSCRKPSLSHLITIRGQATFTVALRDAKSESMVGHTVALDFVAASDQSN